MIGGESGKDFRDETGSATLLAVAMAGVIVVVAAALAVVGAMLNAHRVAQAAADLAALASAHALVDGEDGCGRAAAIAIANGARLEVCTVSGPTTAVTVVVNGPHWLGQRHDLTAQARAGPG